MRRATDGAVIAYFSMEIALESAIPTYAGGLGVLAGDVLRGAADIGVPLIAVTLLHRQGQFRQTIDAAGQQHEHEAGWSPESIPERFELQAPRVEIEISGRRVGIRAWRYVIAGFDAEIPVFLLDTLLPENDETARALTGHLYGGDERYRLEQEAVLGLGGVAMLEALGYADVRTFHMNEGHSALLTLALLERALREHEHDRAAAVEAVRARTVFTTHTPVPAGHDRFPVQLVRSVLGPERATLLHETECCPGDSLNMTLLALRFARYVNGVAMRHGEISQDMFPGYPIGSITNGVHAPTWVATPLATVFDRHLPGWRHENFNLRYALGIPLSEIGGAHEAAKRDLVSLVAARTGRQLDPGRFTIGFARRATAYKRPGLLFDDVERLRAISTGVAPLQIVYSGKAHPRDEGGKGAIRAVFAAARALGDDVPVAYLPDYDMDVARAICSGVDLWLNTPLRPLEASGTSGMKAALNGVPSLSVLDGWWIEGHIEGVTGWAIGSGWEVELDPAADARSLYDQLEHRVLPLWRDSPDGYRTVMRSAIALNGSFFTAQRMLYQYAERAYET